MHIGHAKSICLNFGIAREFGGVCNLRMDDTNPTKEEVEYVESITEDVKWLIEGWADNRLGLKFKGKTPETIAVDGRSDFYLAPSNNGPEPGSKQFQLEPFYASDYFEQLYEYALILIRNGDAYVCDLSPQDTDQYRGSPDRPGKRQSLAQPFRRREPGLLHPHAKGRISGRGPHLARQDRHGFAPTFGCAIRCSIASGIPSIITPETNGAFIRCTILLIA